MTARIKIVKQRNIFISYSRTDFEHARKLYNHLLEFRNAYGGFVFWDNREIKTGTLWEQALQDGLEKADVFLLLISDDFLNSDYCFELEAGRALQRHLSNEAKVFVILLSDCSYENTSPKSIAGKVKFGNLQLAGPFFGGRLKAIETWEHPDTAWEQIIRKIYADGFGIGTGNFQAEYANKETAAPASDRVDRFREIIAECDRNKQCKSLAELVQNNASRRRPLLAVACCCDHDYPQQFISRFLRKNTIFTKELCRSTWSFPLPDPDDADESFLGNYPQEFLEGIYQGWSPGDKPKNALKEMVKKLDGDPSPKIFWQELDTDAMSIDTAIKYLRKMIFFLQSWPNLKQTRVLVILFFNHGKRLRPDFMPFGVGANNQPPVAADENPGQSPQHSRQIMDWQSSGQKLVPFSILPPLTPLERHDVVAWLNSYQNQINLMSIDFQKVKDSVLSKHDEMKEKMHGLPMKHLVELLQDYTDRPINF